VDSLELAIIAFAAVVAIGVVIRISSRSRTKDEVESEPSQPVPKRPASSNCGLSGSDLVAVIAAAVAVESGMAPDSFRVTGISPASGQSIPGAFNTPPWGFVDRLSRSARI
jgi:hypothetical protein